ncbi:MAG: acyltransferase [Clostridia bacterium]|nr:acyltransferase [Clostridia bacterium]
MTVQKSKRYDGLDGLRAYAALGVVAVHTAANSDYQLHSVITDNVLYPLSYAPFLFMMISAFSMCCGYYERIKKGEITLNEFYSKRYVRILPFFALLTVLEAAYTHTLPAYLEAITHMSLTTGLLPNNAAEISKVGWALGMIFLFYLFFPWFVFLFDNVKRGSAVVLLGCFMMVLCMNYWYTDRFVAESFNPRTNFLYCFPFFGAGCLIYLLKDKLLSTTQKHRALLKWTVIVLLTILALIHQNISETVRQLYLLVYYSLVLILGFATPSRVLVNRVTRFVSEISLEIYLSHMAAYRIAEKLGFMKLPWNNELGFLVSLTVVLGLTILGDSLYKSMEKKVIASIRRRKIVKIEPPAS